MTAKDKATLKADNLTTFPTGTGNILAADERTFNDDNIDSFINTEETTTQTISGPLDVQGNNITGAPNIDRAAYAGWSLAPALSVNAGDDTAFDISAGEGQFIDLSDPENPVLTSFSFPGATAVAGTLLGSPSVRQTFITVNSSGTIIQRPVAPDEQEAEDELFSGNMTHGDGVGTNDIFDDATDTPFTSYSVSRTVREFIRIFGGINVSGLVYSGVTSTLSIQHTSGSGLGMGRNYDVDVAFPDTPIAAAENPVSAIIEKYEDLSGNLITANADAFVDVNQYRDPGTGALVSMTNNRWQVKRLFFFYRSDTTLMYYGNAEYSTKAGALNGVVTEAFNEHPDSREAAFRGYLVVQEGATDLTDIATAEFRTTGGFRSSGSAQGLTTIVTLDDAYTSGNQIDVDTNAVILKGATGLDTDPLLTGQNNASSDTFEVLANGDVTAANYFGDISNTTGAPVPTFSEYFSQTRSSTQALAIAVPTTIIPNVADTTARGTVLNTSTGITTITSTTEGVYGFTFGGNVLINGTATPPILTVRVNVNGSTRKEVIFPFGGNTVGVFGVSITAKLELVDTDFVDITILNGTLQAASLQDTGLLYNVTKEGE